jgi:hypothetical protein
MAKRGRSFLHVGANSACCWPAGGGEQAVALGSAAFEMQKTFDGVVGQLHRATNGIFRIERREPFTRTVRMETLSATVVMTLPA